MRGFWTTRSGRILVSGALVVLASAALVSVVQASGSSSSGPAAATQYDRKVTICHRTGSQKNPFVTIRVSRNALPAHLRHGDRLGPCEGMSFTVCMKAKGKKAKTMRVKFRALKAQMRKGAKLGPCKTKAKGGPANKSKNKGKGPKPPKRK